MGTQEINPSKPDKKLKRKKTKSVVESEEITEAPSILKKSKASEELYVPSQSEIDASVKCAEKKTKSKRQIKREKQQAREQEAEVVKSTEQHSQILNYLSKWKHSKDQWKFEKKKNVYIFHNILDSTKIPETIWNTVLEYVQTSSGNVRKKAIEDAMKIIENGDQDVDSVDEEKYKRARTLIQFLDE